MSGARDDGGPAFPFLTASESSHEVTTHEGHHGMSLRDYFAAKALASMDDTHAVRRGTGFDGGFSETSLKEAAALAASCYVIADAMLKARQHG